MKFSSAQPPRDLPYEQLDDWYNQASLEANGVSPTPEALLATLTGPDESLRPVAAHGLGVIGDHAAEPELIAASQSDDDHLAVQAAWALARLGRAEGIQALQSLSKKPGEASVVPALAAGCLARFGHPEGLDVISRGLDQSNRLLRIAATKQLFFFLPFQSDARDVTGLYRRALHDSDEDVQWAALFQLSQVPPDEATPLVEEFEASNPTGWLASEAARIGEELRS
jgi:HEAT repeat protein